MAPPTGELLDLALYLGATGAVTLGAGWTVLRLAEHMPGFTVHGKAFLGTAIVGTVALLNVLIVAELMFVSDDHDLNVLIALVAFSAILTAFLSQWIAAAISDKTTAIASAVRSLAAGDLRTRLDMGKGDELASLAEDVDTLASRLEAAEEQRAALDRERRELTIAVSHDLRTPLASLRAMVEALADGVVDDPAEVRRYYDTMGREIERLGRMIDDLFELAQMDAGALRLDVQNLRLSEIAGEVVDAMRAQANTAGIELTLENGGEPRQSAVDGARIERALANLVRNAIEHTPSGGRVGVSVSTDNGWSQVSVTDSGEGIAEADLPHVWERFYRAEKSRKRALNQTDGAGLGLSIVRGIVEAHGGEVSASSQTGRGSSFVIKLPAP